MKTPKLLASGLLFALLTATTAQAQVTIDVSKISCDQFTLYSVGHDRVDNDGRVTKSSTYFHYQHGYPSGYDFDLDTLTRP